MAVVRVIRKLQTTLMCTTTKMSNSLLFFDAKKKLGKNYRFGGRRSLLKGHNFVRPDLLIFAAMQQNGRPVRPSDEDRISLILAFDERRLPVLAHTFVERERTPIYNHLLSVNPEMGTGQIFSGPEGIFIWKLDVFFNYGSPLSSFIINILMDF